MTYYDFIVIGSGISGLNFALNASKKGKVLVVTKKNIIESTTNYAQGGIAAVLGKLDDFKKHINDTLVAGAYHNNKRAVEYMVKHGPEQIKKLLELGVPFEHKKDSLELTKEGGHSVKRIAFVGDRTGHSIETTLIRNVKNNKNIKIWENTFAVDLLVKNKKCYGLQVIKNKRIENIFSSSVILATGGLGQVYEKTTNPKISTGDGIAMASRAGCEMKDLEFIQFHPTALNMKRKKKFLLSEAMRGEGAILINSKGKKFMKKYDEHKELAPRDIVARAIYEEEKNGKVFLDISYKDSKFIKKRFPYIYKELKKRGIDITKEKIPVSPAAHYVCGGIKVNLDGETNIKNLYSFGEVACTGVHGANRLASNSLLEAVVFSSRIAGVIKKQPKIKYPYFKKLKIYKNKINNNLIRRKIKKIMWENVGIIRSKEKLTDALKKLEKIKKDFKLNSLDISALETRNLLDVALLITKAAIKRKKSLGCHFIIS